MDLIFLGVGSTIGSGWLYGAMKGVQYAGSLAWMSWIIGAIIFILIGLVYAELAAALPRSGGFLRYPDFTHGSVTGFMVSFFAFLGYTSMIGVEAVAVRQYATYYWGALTTDAGDPTFLGFIVQSAIVVCFFL
nr:amino acid permease [Virgibacillus ihumii]